MTTTPTPTTAPVKFLLVDDREENLIALEALLERDDLILLKAQSGEEALEYLLKNDVALALLDVQMPGMDGFELAEIMRGSERSRHVPIIFVTGDPTQQKRVFQGYDAGAVDFLIKPIEPGILKHKTATFFSLYKQRQLLEETLRLNETFVAAVGHDLKNPLNSIVMSAGLLAEKANDPATAKLVERVKSSGLRMARMIDDLFDLSRARFGQGIPVERAQTDALAIAQRAIAEQEQAAKDRSILLTHEGSLEGNWDADRIHQVLCNLLSNALRYGDPQKPITLSLKGEPNEVVLAVHNGGSIPPSVLPHIFDPFRQHAEDKRTRTGLGLGLYIVDQLVLAHGGKVSVVSTPDEGTTFTLRLPRYDSPESSKPAE